MSSEGGPFITGNPVPSPAAGESCGRDGILVLGMAPWHRERPEARPYAMAGAAGPSRQARKLWNVPVERDSVSW